MTSLSRPTPPRAPDAPQTSPAARRLAWGVAAGAMLVSAAGFVTAVAYAAVTGDTGALLSHVVLTPFITMAFAVVGALVARRHPGNAIGWIFLAVATLFALNVGIEAYLDAAVLLGFAAGSAGGRLAQWMGVWLWAPAVFLPTVFVFLLFPDGRLLSRRWQGVFWAGVAGLVMTAGGLALHPGPLDTWGTGPNSLGVPAAAPVLEAALAVGGLLLAGALVGAILSFVLRFRRAQGVARQQLKWLLVALLWMALGFAAGGLLRFAFPEQEWVTELGIGISNLTILGIAVAASVAILRAGLYDIDLIINRTLVYAGLSAASALSYAVMVSTTGYFLQTDDNLAGLLLTAALVLVFFRPLRAGIQQRVDALVGEAPRRVAAPGRVTAPGEVAAVDTGAAPAPAEGPEAAAVQGRRDLVLLVGLAGLLVGLALAFVGVRLATPFANDRLPPEETLPGITAAGVRVTPLAAGPAGLQPGDVVTAVDGRALAAWLASALGTAAKAGAPESAGVAVAGRWQVGDTVTYTVRRQGESQDVAVTLAPYPLGAIVRLEWGTLLYYTLFLVIAGILFLRRPRLAAARVLFLGAAAQFGALPWSLGLQASDFVHQAGLWLYQLTTVGGFLLAFIAYFHFALVFPQPVSLVRRRWFLPLVYGLPYLLLAVYLPVSWVQSAGLLVWVGRWGWATGPHAVVFTLLTLVTISWQYRHSRGKTRRQIRWLVLAAILVAGTAMIFYFVPPMLGERVVGSNVIGLIGLLFPAAVAISILRYNLFDIDTLLNRALVYGALTTVIITLYVLLVGLLGTALQARGNLFVALVATGVAAVLFQPLRDRLQRGVNRFMYGERDEPFEVLARLGQRLESTLSPEMVYPTIVETVSQALKLPYAAVAVWRHGRLETVQSYGKPVPHPVTYPLTYQGEPVGQLLVARRAPDEAFSPADERILRNVVRQAGAAVHAVQLMADLQRSRQQLVTAREEERRRLRRDLHDGLGPQLASQTLTIEAIDRLLARDPERARALLHDLKAQSQAAVQDIRRLVYALRPPALDELGLAGALREAADRQSVDGLRVTVTAPETLPPLPAAVEVAAYRVAQEAMTNVVRHAGAGRCDVTLALMGAGSGSALRVTVVDDGRGLPADYRPGVGLQSMRERAVELGGACQVESADGRGVQVAALFPLPAPG